MEYKFTPLDNDQDVECCNSAAIFVLENGEHSFAVHLEVILACLRLAEENGIIPRIPECWWGIVFNAIEDHIWRESR